MAILDEIPIGQDHNAALLGKRRQFLLNLRFSHNHLGQDQHFVACQVTFRRDDIHWYIPVIKDLVIFFHFPFAVQQNALSLDAEGRQGIIVVHNRHLAADRGLQRMGVVFDLPEKALDLIELSPLYIVRVQHAITKLLGALGGPPVTEKEDGCTAPGHTLIGPHLRLVGPGRKAGDIMPLGAHNGLSDPEVLLFQPPDIVQAKGDLVGREGLPLSAPHRIIVVGCKIKVSGQGGIVHVLAQSSAGEVVHDHRVRDDFL